MELPVNTAAIAGKAPFGAAVSEWTRVLKTLQHDAAFAQAIERNDLLRSIATRRLSAVEASAVEGGVLEVPDIDDLARAKTHRGEVLWMLGARHACDTLATRLGKEALESPAQLAVLQAQAREALADARPMTDELALWEYDDDLGPTYKRFAAAVDELEAELARFSTLGDVLWVSTDQRVDRSAADRHMTEWGWVLDGLHQRLTFASDPNAVVAQARALIEGLVTGYADRASRDTVRETAMTYNRLLALARAHGRAVGDEGLGREAVDAYRSTREVLDRLVPPTAEEEAAEREARAGELAELLQYTAPDEPRAGLWSPRVRRAAITSLLGVVAIAAGVWVAFIRPSLNFDTLDSRQVRQLWPELTGGYVVQRSKGRLFVGYLVRQDQQAPTRLVAQMSQKMLDDLKPLGVTDVLILDRNNVPLGLMQGAR